MKHALVVVKYLLPLVMVASLQASTRGTYGQQVVAAVLMAEAWGEGEKAMTAVAEVIRQRSVRWKLSPLAVVKRPRHFSCLNSTRPEKLIRRFHREKDFAKALEIARTLYNEPHKLPGLAKGATHFHDDSLTPYWARGEEPVEVIGKLLFYTLPL